MWGRDYFFVAKCKLDYCPWRICRVFVAGFCNFTKNTQTIELPQLSQFNCVSCFCPRNFRYSLRKLTREKAKCKKNNRGKSYGNFKHYSKLHILSNKYRCFLITQAVQFLELKDLDFLYLESEMFSPLLLKNNHKNQVNVNLEAPNCNYTNICVSPLRFTKKRTCKEKAITKHS